MKYYAHPHPHSNTFHALPPDGGQTATKSCEICGLRDMAEWRFDFPLQFLNEQPRSDYAIGVSFCDTVYKIAFRSAKATAAAFCSLLWS